MLACYYKNEGKIYYEVGKTMDFRFRVRAAAIILNEARELLLVLHRNPLTAEEWWTPPGGGLGSRESASETIIREVQEECGIKCRPGKLVYVREFLGGTEKCVHHVELYFLAEAEHYQIQTGSDPEIEKQFIIEARFLSRKEIEKSKINVFPEVLKDSFWDDLESGFTGHTVYLGLRDPKGIERISIN